MASIPVVDFSSTDRITKAQEIVQAMETVGFLYLDNIPGYDVNYEEELLRYTKWFFAFPLEKKLQLATKKYNKSSKRMYRGYFGLDENYSSYKEALEFGPYPDYWSNPDDVASGLPITEENVWPEPDEAERQDLQRCKEYRDFKTFMTNHYRLMQDMSFDFLKLLSMGLGLQETYFDKFFETVLSTLRIMRYPKRDFEPSENAYEDGRKVCCGQHKDNTFVTFLTTFEYQGLEVRPINQPWIKVAPRPGSVVVNLGAMLAESTGNRIQATLHRVMDLGQERHSVPFFLEPGYNSTFPKVLPTAVEKKDGSTSWELEENVEYITYGPWLRQQMSSMYEEYRHLATQDSHT